MKSSTTASSRASRAGGRSGRPLFILAAALTALTLAVIVAGCGSSTASSSASPSSAPIKMGGVLKIGAEYGNGDFDPVLFAGAVGDLQLQAQIYQGLVTPGPDYSVQPLLATKWSSPNGKVWTFTLRSGVRFSNGKPFTSADVVYSMNRVRSTKLGSPDASLFANVKSITAPNSTTVIFNLTGVDSEFPASLTEYRELMLCKSVKNPAKNPVGTGPFMLKSISPEDQAILVKNPYYWGKDAQGNQLPYLDQLDFVYSPDISGQVASLQGGALNYVATLNSEQKQIVQSSSSLQLLEQASNYCYELQIRCDQKPGSNLKVRQALLAGTNLASIAALVDPGVATPGNATLVGPVYKADYLSTVPAYDPAKAKQLLAQAGYPNGLKLTLVAQNAPPMPDIATAWVAQMAKIGVNASIQEVPTGSYYTDKGTDTWYEAPFSIVDWGPRATPITFFKLCLTSDAPWNYSRWKDPQFDSITRQIATTLNPAARSALYRQAQQILQEQVPMINFGEFSGVAGVSKDVDGIALAPDWSRTVFGDAHFTQ